MIKNTKKQLITKIEQHVVKVAPSHTTNRLEPTTNRLEPTTNRLEPTTNRLEPTTNRLEPTTDKLAPAVKDLAINKAIKITKTTDKTAQLEAFVTSLGVAEKVELYLYNSNAYININVILAVLSVDLSWFIKNAELNTHYIKLVKGVYINKYGITKLLGQSKEAISFKLQDYLYDIFYQVETKGVAIRSDIKSRNELIKAANLADKLEDVTKELELYHTVEMSNKNLITDLSTSFEMLKNEYASLDAENQMINDKYIDLQDEYKQLAIEYNHIRMIATTLAKHIRVKKSDIPEAHDDNLDVDDLELDKLDVDDEKKIYKEAQLAKVRLTAIQKQQRKNKTIEDSNPVCPKTRKTKTDKAVIVGKKTYTILRSSYPTHGHSIYRWEITDKQYDDDFKSASTEFISEDEYIVTDVNGIISSVMPPPMVWFSDINASNEKIKAVNLFLRLSDFCSTVDTIDQLIEII